MGTNFTLCFGSNKFEVGFYVYYQGGSSAAHCVTFESQKGIFINNHCLISAKECASKEAIYILDQEWKLEI